jgi:hypothetical protein
MFLSRNSGQVVVTKNESLRRRDHGEIQAYYLSHQTMFLMFLSRNSGQVVVKHDPLRSVVEKDKLFKCYRSETGLKL